MDKTMKNRVGWVVIGFALVLISLLFTKNCSAQDLIITTTNDSIFCKILDQDNSYIYYNVDRKYETTLRLPLKSVKYQKQNWVRGELLNADYNGKAGINFMGKPGDYLESAGTTLMTGLVLNLLSVSSIIAANYAATSSGENVGLIIGGSLQITSIICYFVGYGKLTRAGSELKINQKPD
jgi:hypothetical protein